MIRFDERTPIYLQLRREIEKAIIDGSIQEQQMLPSIRTLAQEYNINPQTVANALGELVDNGMIYKQRGIGFFVHERAREALLTRWQEEFRHYDLVEVLNKGRSLGVTETEVIDTVHAIYQETGENHEFV
jgi:DNA-binding transcriptional regulator YhcF (GntR family)